MSVEHATAGIPSTIGADQLNRLIAEHGDLVIVDVRNAQIFDKQGWNTFPSAKIIPLEELKSRLNELPKNRLIVTACMAGGRSATARSILKENGYEQVELARFDEYVAKDYPIVAVERSIASKLLA